MAEYFAGGHLRFVNGEWRDDNGNAIEISRVRHGRWVKIYENGEPAIAQHQVGVFCIKCMKMPKDKFTESDFCPNCGAKMDLE